jgi:hypothetical protein
MFGSVALVMAFGENLSTLEVVGEYIRGHFVRWTAQFPLWKIFTLISAVLSLGTAGLLQKSRKEGGYLGIISF